MSDAGRDRTPGDQAADLIEGAREALAEAFDVLVDAGHDDLAGSVERLRTRAQQVKADALALSAAASRQT